jgi:CcmD family protein
MGFLTAAFVAVWLLVTLYVVYISFRQRSLERELAGIEEALQERQGGRAS